MFYQLTYGEWPDENRHMQIARLQNEKSVHEIVARLYDLKPGDSRVGAAAKALLAANPHLSGNVATLPTGTPMVAPGYPGSTPQAPPWRIRSARPG
jgi:hypothetical protein